MGQSCEAALQLYKLRFFDNQLLWLCLYRRRRCWWRCIWNGWVVRAGQLFLQGGFWSIQETDGSCRLHRTQGARKGQLRKSMWLRLADSVFSAVRLCRGVRQRPLFYPVLGLWMSEA